MREDWQTVTLGNVCSFENGDRGKNYPGRKAFVEKGFPFVNAGHLTDGSIDHDSMNFISQERFDLLGNGKIKKGDLLFCLRGSLGKYALIDYEYSGAIASSLVIVRPVNPLSGYYLSHYFGSELCSRMIGKYMNGAAQPNLSAKNLKEFKIPLPPLPEQERIVSILDKAFEGIDKAIAQTEQNLASARELFESYLNNAVTGQITKGWRQGRENMGSASEALELRLRRRRFEYEGKGKYKEPKPPIAHPEISLPAHWVLTSPEQVSNNIVDCPHSTPKWAETGMVCLRTTNFRPGFLDLESVRFVSDKSYADRITRLEPMPGDILYSREGGILGIACMIPENLKACLGQRMMLFRLDTTIVDPRFFTAVLNSPLILGIVKALTGGAAAPHINIRDVRTFPIPLPPLSEQSVIAHMLGTQSDLINYLEALYIQKLNDLKELKQSLLQQAFAGELTKEDAA